MLLRLMDSCDPSSQGTVPLRRHGGIIVRRRRPAWPSSEPLARCAIPNPPPQPMLAKTADIRLLGAAGYAWATPLAGARMPVCTDVALAICLARLPV